MEEWMNLFGAREKGLNLAGLFAVWAILFLRVSIAHSGGAGFSGAEFLNIGAGSRAVGMGGAFSAIVDDPSACYWNPAGLTNIRGSALLVQHIEHFMDIKYEYAAYSMPIGERRALGFSISYMHMGSILQYDANDTPLGDFRAYDLAYGVSFGYGINENISLGLGAKNINQILGDVKTQGWAFDTGLLFKLRSVNASLAVGNFGSSLKYELESASLPTEMRLGLAYSSPTYPLILTTEYGYSRDGTTRAALGAEYDFLEGFSLRSGYDFRGVGLDNGDLSFGCGIKMWNQQFDYAYLPNVLWGDSHRVSATFNLSQKQ